MTMKTNVEPLLSYLDELFPDAKCELFYTKDYELVIAVMLSAQTTDKRVNMVTRILWDKYDILCGRPNMASKVQESLKILLDARISFEARTTCDPLHLTPADITRLASDLKNMGVPVYALQKYRTFPGDKNPPEVSAIESFFKSENLNPVYVLYPNLILR